MTKEQTRQLGIEFERRLLTMDPSFILAKLDTDTIYSFLNEAQDLIIKTLIAQEDNIKQDTKPYIRSQEILRTLVVHKLLTVAAYDSSNDGNDDWDNFSQYGDWYCTIFNLTESIDDFLSYIRSSSRVEHTYTDPYNDDPKRLIVPNKFVRAYDVDKVLAKPHNRNAILRSPLATLECVNGDTVLKLIHDTYTDIISSDVTYYRNPKRFSAGANSVDCELPFDLFDSLVSGAVSIYLQYKQPLRQLQQQKQQQQLEDDQ